MPVSNYLLQLTHKSVPCQLTVVSKKTSSCKFNMIQNIFFGNNKGLRSQLKRLEQLEHQTIFDLPSVWSSAPACVAQVFNFYPVIFIGRLPLPVLSWQSLLSLDWLTSWASIAMEGIQRTCFAIEIKTYFSSPSKIKQFSHRQLLPRKCLCLVGHWSVLWSHSSMSVWDASQKKQHAGWVLCGLSSTLIDSREGRWG